MNRRYLIGMLGGTMVAGPLRAFAQSASGLPLVAVLSPVTTEAGATNIAALRKGLADGGIVERRDAEFFIRYANGNSASYEPIAAELLALHPAVIVAGSTGVVLAVHKLTQDVPVVMAGFSSDPIAAGLIDSLARPGHNITGNLLYAGFAARTRKSLSLLQQIAPSIARIGWIGNPEDQNDALGLPAWREAAGLLKLELKEFPVSRADDLEKTFAAAGSGADAIGCTGSPLFLANRSRVVALAAATKLPALFTLPDFARDGGLLAYSPDLPDLYRRAGALAAKILKGAKPADLPVEQPDSYHLVINLKAAKALGLTVPTTLLATADEVIE